MNVRSLNGLIEIISEANMNMTELDFCDTYYEHFLKNANQLRHFEKMASLKTLRIPISSTVQNHRNFTISSSITHLQLMCPDGPVYLYWVLKMFPCLQHLCVKESACELDRSENDSNDNLWVHPTLNSLRLDECTINSRVADYIKALAIILESQGRAFDIDLSGCNLEKFSMSLSSGKASKEDESCRPFKIQNATKQMIHANWGETISLEKTNNDSGILEYKTNNKGLWIKLVTIDFFFN